MQIPKTIRLPHGAYGDDSNVFHVVIRAMPGEAPFSDRLLGDAVWGVLTNPTSREAATLYAACLMPDHLHMLLSPSGRTVIQWANSFKSFSTRVAWGHRSRAALWQPGFFDRRIRDDREFGEVLGYILANPVGAGLVGDSDDWRWVATWVGEG
ncbi:MAG: transposase [Chloroflexi bacterium]|nr:transposase [Chloroflexota bacterium]